MAKISSWDTEITDEERITETYEKIQETVEWLATNGNHSPSEVAGCFMTQGMMMYRSLLDEPDYNDLMETIWSFKNDIDPQEEATIH
jgi:hypothetical protein